MSENQPSHRDIRGVEWPKEMLEGILETAMNARDKFEVRRFASRVISIPTGGVSTLNFSLGAQDKAYLYDAGFKAATRFFAAREPSENSYGKVLPPPPARV